MTPLSRAAQTALKHRPISSSQDMLTHGQAVYDALKSTIGYWYEPAHIVSEIENQTRVKLVRVTDACQRLSGSTRMNYLFNQDKSRRCYWWEIESPLFDFRAAHYTQKEKVKLFWDATAVAIRYGCNHDIDWMVEELVENSTPKRCLTCNKPLGQASLVYLLPVDTDDWKQIREAAERGQLKLWCFCNWKCQPNDRSEKWYLEQAKQKLKRLRQLLRQTQKASN
jgi:hypothetical protein